MLGLPRGGVAVAAEVARALDAQLDALLVRKLGVPGHQELAFGAIASGGVQVLNDEVLASAALGENEIATVRTREFSVLERQEAQFRQGRTPSRLTGRSVILVDDGLATGATMRAAVAAARAGDATTMVVAVPVAPVQAVAAFRAEGVEVRVVLVPKRFLAVGSWYRDFAPVSEEEARALLRAHESGTP